MLRVGIILDSEEVSFWIADLINEISQHKNIHLAVVVSHENRFKRNPKTAYSLFRKIDHTLLPGKPNVLAKVKPGLPKEVPLVKVIPINTETGISYSAEDLENIKRNEVDVLLHFSTENPTGEILTLCKYGVWGLQAGEGTSFNSNSVGFWEWYHQTPVTKISLWQLNNQPGKNECMASSLTKTEYLSLSRNQTSVFSKGIDLLIGTLVRFTTSEYSKRNDAWLNRAFESSNPGTWTSLFAVGKLLSRVVSKSITKVLFIEQWILFFSFSSPNFPQLNFRNFKPLIPPKDRIWADPFVVSENDKHYLFIEELRTKTNKGHISCMVLNKNGEVENPTIIIDQPFHLSYPFIFQHEGTWFMVPESADNMTVDLYECLEFPFKWKFKKSLLTNVRAFDATLHFHDGKVWLFCTIQKRSGSSTNDDLHIFFAEHLLDAEWKPHAGNPVLSNPYSARPAGRIFEVNNSWYRPSQICVPRYGYGLSLNRITKLDESNYHEENINEILPDWRKNLLSTHTLNFVRDLTIIDGQIKRFRFF